MAITFDRINKWILVTSPQTTVDIQDLINKIRDYEDNLENLDLLQIANCTGKQSLGGTVFVGLTLELLDDWKIKFEDRLGPTTTTCYVSGGNLAQVGGIYPLEASDYVFVVVTSSSSATLQNQKSLEFASFGGGVAIDVINGVSGTAFPVGTRQSPSNNLYDAHEIAEERGMNTFFLMKSLTLSEETMQDGYVFRGDSQVNVTVTIEPSIDITNAEFQNVRISGTLDGNNSLKECEIIELNYINGTICNCAISGTVTLGGNRQANFINCFSTFAGESVEPPTINLAGGGQSLVVRYWSGGLKLVNLTSSGDTISLDMESGHVILDSSLVSGTIVVRGVAQLTDNTGPGCTVDNNYLIPGAKVLGETISNAVWDVTIVPTHTASDSAGELLYGAGGGASPSTIADAVWSSAIVGNTGSGTFGEKVGKKVLTFVKWLALKD